MRSGLGGGVIGVLPSIFLFELEKIPWKESAAASAEIFRTAFEYIVFILTDSSCQSIKNLHNAKGVNPEKLIAKFPCDKNSISESLRELRDYDSGAMIVEITFVVAAG